MQWLQRKKQRLTECDVEDVRARLLSPELAEDITAMGHGLQMQLGILHLEKNLKTVLWMNGSTVSNPEPSPHFEMWNMGRQMAKVLQMLNHSESREGVNYGPF